MKILVIGGTRFVGKYLVDSALARGHEVTLFNRGQTNPGLFPQVEAIRGDREHDLGKLSGRTWDAVIDVAGYVPRMVRLSAGALGSSGRYVFISSISACADMRAIGIDENYPLATMENQAVEEINAATYGPLKALCEQTVRDIFQERALIVRPGLIVGPDDPTDRFTYWPVRVARGGSVLAPEGEDVAMQFVDVRDLADFTVKLIEDRAAGAYNVTGPDYQLTWGRMLAACKAVAQSDATFHWASVEFLKANQVAPWSDLPVWMPATGDKAGLCHFSVAKAIRAGLVFRPLEETIRDTIAWEKTRPADHGWKGGLKGAREEELLQLLQGK